MCAYGFLIAVKKQCLLEFTFSKLVSKVKGLPQVTNGLLCNIHSSLSQKNKVYIKRWSECGGQVYSHPVFYTYQDKFVIGQRLNMYHFPTWFCFILHSQILIFFLFVSTIVQNACSWHFNNFHSETDYFSFTYSSQLSYTWWRGKSSLFHLAANSVNKQIMHGLPTPPFLKLMALKPVSYTSQDSFVFLLE